MKTEIISSFLCTGKSTYCKNNLKAYDLEFWESKLTLGMNSNSNEKVFESFVNILEEMVKTNYYEKIFITDDYYMLKELMKRNIKFTLVTPKLNDLEFLKEHKKRTINRDSLKWYNNVVVPTLKNLNLLQNELKNYKNVTIKYLSNEKPFVEHHI